MTSPEPEAPQPSQHGWQQYSQPVGTPEQLAYERGRQDAVRQLTTPRMTGYRIACGVCWALWTLLFIVGIFTGPGIAGHLLCIPLAGLSGWYDYRIWTLKSRRLTFFLLF